VHQVEPSAGVSEGRGPRHARFSRDGVVEREPAGEILSVLCEGSGRDEPFSGSLDRLRSDCSPDVSDDHGSHDQGHYVRDPGAVCGEVNLAAE